MCEYCGLSGLLNVTNHNYPSLVYNHDPVKWLAYLSNTIVVLLLKFERLERPPLPSNNNSKYHDLWPPLSHFQFDLDTNSRKDGKCFQKKKKRWKGHLINKRIGRISNFSGACRVYLRRTSRFF